MSHSPDDRWIAQPQVFTLHWEGPPTVATAEEPRFPDSRAEERQRAAEERENDLRELSQGERGRALWDQIRTEATTRGDEDPATWRGLPTRWATACTRTSSC
jgi:hypothetical protein